jgi:hypothetical protein
LGRKPDAQAQSAACRTSLLEQDTPAGRPESISGRWQRDPAGQVGSIELLGGSAVDWREASWCEGGSGSGSQLACLGFEDKASIWLDEMHGVVAPPLFRSRIGLAEHF